VRVRGEGVTTRAESIAEPTPTHAVYERMPRLAHAALVVLTGFLASRVLGVVRQIVVAAHFGTGTEFSAYVTAISLPDLVFQVLVGGAVGSAFIPVFKQYLAGGKEDDAWRLTSSVINTGMLAASGTALVLAIFARPVMDLWVPGSDPEFRDLAAGLTRILLIAPAIFAVSTFCSSVLNSFNRFAAAALAPLMYNLAIIAAAVLLSGPLGIYGLAIGAVVGALLHLLVQVPALVKVGMRWQPMFDLGHAGVREVGRLFAPRVLGLGVVQLNQVLSGIVFASFLGATSISYLNYAWQMLMMPLALAMAVGTAVFPTLSEASALGDRGHLRQVFLLSLRLILFLSIPASIGLIVLGEPVIRLFFQRNQFGPESTAGTAYAMVFYAIGLAGHATVEIVDRVFYALHDTRTPVFVAVGAVVANVLLSLTLMQTPLSFGGLALANSLAALIEAALLVRLVTGRLTDLDMGRLGVSAVRILAASLVMGFPIAWLAHSIGPLLSPYGTAGQALLVGGCAVIGAALYGLISLLLQSEELAVLRRLVTKR
jgi:putative peptidoglycan lipid II flippase